MIDHDVLPCILQWLSWKDRTIACCTCRSWLEASVQASKMQYAQQQVLHWESMSPPDTPLLSLVKRCSIHCRGAPPEWIHDIPCTHLSISIPFHSNIRQDQYELRWRNPSVTHLEVYVRMTAADFGDCKDPMISIDPDKDLQVGRLSFLRIHAKFQDGHSLTLHTNDKEYYDDDGETGAEVWVQWASWLSKGLRCLDIASHRITFCDDKSWMSGKRENYDFHDVSIMYRSKWCIVCQYPEYWQIDEWYRLDSIGLNYVAQIENANEHIRIIASNADAVEFLSGLCL